MASYTNPILHAVGDDLAVTDYNAVANNTVFLAQRPYISAYNSSSTGFGTGSTTVVGLQSTNISGYGFSLSSNNIVVPLTGIYMVTGCLTVQPESVATPVGFIAITHNGSAVGQGGAGTGANSNPIYVASQIVSASATDTIGMTFFQNSGNSLASATGAQATYLSVYFVGSQ